MQLAISRLQNGISMWQADTGDVGESSKMFTLLATYIKADISAGGMGTSELMLMIFIIFLAIIQEIGIAYCTPAAIIDRATLKLVSRYCEWESNIEKEENLYKVICENNNYYAKYILIASGKTPRKLICKNSNKYEGKGISYCTICDGALYKNKTVIVLGGGNTAMESAKYMSNIANKIYIVNRSPLRADLKEQEIIKDEKVEVILNATIKEIIGDENHITEVILNDDRKIKADAIFVCIGKELSGVYYQNLNIKTDNLGIIVDKDMKTSNSSIYAAGDVISKSLYQVVTATGEGALAASSIIKSLKK